MARGGNPPALAIDYVDPDGPTRHLPDGAAVPAALEKEAVRNSSILTQVSVPRRF